MAKMNWKSRAEINQKQKEQALLQQVSAENHKRDEAVKAFITRQVERMIAADELSEEEQQLFLNVFPPFEIGKAYQTGEKVRHGGRVYEVIQAHTSQLDWLPQDVPALYKEYLQKETSDGDEVIHDWKQPQGGHDSYSKGDKVKFDGNIYESKINNNIWSPFDYPAGWEKAG